MDTLIAKLLEQSPIAITLGVGIYTLYNAYQDQIKYSRGQDLRIAEILSKLVPVVDGLKEGTLQTGANLDRNLTAFDAGQDAINCRIERMTASIERLEISVNAFLSHVKGREK